MMDAMEKALNSSRLRTEPSFILLYCEKIGLNFTTIIVNYFLPFKAEAVSVGKKRYLKRYKFISEMRNVRI